MRRRNTQASRRGAILPLVVLCSVALIGLIALAVDIGMVAVARSQCQLAADAAAMAGARTINGNSVGNYNVGSVPGNAVAAAVTNQVLSQYVAGDPKNVNTVNAYTYSSGQVTVQVGSYAYVWNDSNVATEGFQVAVPRTGTEPYSAVVATVNGQGSYGFGRIFGMKTFNTTGTATAVHRPRDVMIVMDLSGSMRFESLPGVPLNGTDNWGNSGTFAAASWGSVPRTASLNPETVIPQFGHYADTAGAALIGTTSYIATSGEFVDATANISTTTISGPPVIEDFFQNAVGTAPSSANKAFSRAPDSYATLPGGDNYLKKTLNSSASYANNLYDFVGADTPLEFANGTNPPDAFEKYGYNYDYANKAPLIGKFNGYTQGPGYWGKTFWIWPPQPAVSQGAAGTVKAPVANTVLAPPSSLTDTTFQWYNNGSLDWRQRFFVAVNTATNAPSWIQHNNVLFDTTGSGANWKRPGNTTTVTENGASVTYDFRVNYAAILYWLTQAPNPFPSTLQAGRIRYYSSIPSGTDNSLNNRWWTTAPSSLPNDERFWKAYIDFVLGYEGTGANTYNRFQWGVPIASLIGNGDYYTPAGATVQITSHPDRLPTGTFGSAGGPFSTDPYTDSVSFKTTSLQAKGSTTLAIQSGGALNYNPSSPSGVTSTYGTVTVGAATNYYTIGSGGTTTSVPLATSGGLAADIPKGTSVTVKIYSPYMDYQDCPPRPRHQLWFGPMTFVDWLGNYNLYDLMNNSAPHHWWPGTAHEAQGWTAKVGIQTAIGDIQNNHPNDYVGLTFFSSPMYNNSDIGHHNRAVVPMGQNYSALVQSLWFPPSTVSGGVKEISPYDADMRQVPRADGGTSPEMGFMIAYNQLSSSINSLRFYAKPQPQYKGDAGGMGRQGAQRIVVFETDGFPNTASLTSLAGSGADSYYPIRVTNPQNLPDSANVEWPSGGSYMDSDVFTVVKQICALTTDNPPGFSTTRKKALVHGIGFGDIFEPSNAGTASQNNALTFLQSVQYYGNTALDTVGANFPANKRVYGTSTQRVAAMQAAFTNILQSGVQVSLIK
jgi:hypothetical protein